MKNVLTEGVAKIIFNRESMMPMLRRQGDQLVAGFVLKGDGEFIFDRVIENDFAIDDFMDKYDLTMVTISNR